MKLAHLHLQDTPYRVKKTLCGIKVTRLAKDVASIDISQPPRWPYPSFADRLITSFEEGRRTRQLCSVCKDRAALVVLEQSI